MNLFNLLGTGQDLNTGSFVTLNGKAWRESIADFRKAFTEANNMGGTKKGKLLSWLAGNFNSDYDLAKNLDTDTVALQKFLEVYKKGDDKVKIINESIKGNTAQFSPYGLSTASAAAARHLRCQNAR